MNLSDKETEQVSRILTKIIMLEDFDSKHEVFGASSHKYQWHDPASLWDVEEFEKKHRVELPRDYKIFLCFISNGAPFVAYGLYPLEKLEVLGDLAKDNILYPNMETDDFSALVTMIESDMNKDASEEIYNGLLLIGTEGCGYDFGLVVSGKYRGRLMLTDGNLENPFIFSYDIGFLDMYERWLDAYEEGIDPSRVLLTIPKSEAELLKDYHEESKNYKEDIISTLDAYDHLEEDSLITLKQLVSEEQDLYLKSQGLKLIHKYDEDFVNVMLKEDLYSEDRAVIENFVSHEIDLFVFRDEDYKRLYELLSKLVEDELVNYSKAIRALKGSIYHQFDHLKEFLNHPDPKVRSLTVRLIEETPDFREHKQELYYLLEDEDVRVIRETLQVLIKNTMTDEYLELFEPLAKKYHDDDFIPSHIERYLHKIKVDLDYYK